MRPFQQKSSDLLRLSLKRRGDAGIVAIKERKKVVTLFLIAFLVVLLACAGDFAENFAILRFSKKVTYFPPKTQTKSK